MRIQFLHPGKQGKEMHYSVMSSDKLAWSGTVKTVEMNVTCITLTCHQHIGNRHSPSPPTPTSHQVPTKFETIKTDLKPQKNKIKTKNTTEKRVNVINVQCFDKNK